MNGFIIELDCGIKNEAYAMNGHSLCFLELISTQNLISGRAPQSMSVEGLVKWLAMILQISLAVPLAVPSVLEDR